MLLRHYSEFKKIFIDIDDTLIKTTKTLDQFSKYPLTPVHPLNGRWKDFDDVIIHLNDTLYIPLYEGVLELFFLLKNRNFRIVSASPDIKFSRVNKINALKELNLNSEILFFESDDDKIIFLKEHASELNDLVIDDKQCILDQLSCSTLLVNKDLNNNALSIEDLVYNWK